MAESGMERFRRMMDRMEFETLPLFSKPYFSWRLHTDYVGRRFVYRPTSDSTMEDARRMLDRFRLTNGALLLAETQSDGRGRAGRAWVSPPDVNLYFTVIVTPPPLAMTSLSYVTPLAVAYAVEDAAERLGVKLRADLKWPNDVLIDGKKLAGVLIETTATAAGESVALVGVGINVNVDVDAYVEIRDIATSLQQVVGKPVAREEVLAAFCNHFESLLEAAASGDAAPFAAWRDRLVNLGRPVVANGAVERIEGVAVDVDATGALVIERGDGSRVTVDAGDVTLQK